MIISDVIHNMRINGFNVLYTDRLGEGLNITNGHFFKLKHFTKTNSFMFSYTAGQSANEIWEHFKRTFNIE